MSKYTTSEYDTIASLLSWVKDFQSSRANPVPVLTDLAGALEDVTVGTPRDLQNQWSDPRTYMSPFRGLSNMSAWYNSGYTAKGAVDAYLRLFRKHKEDFLEITEEEAASSFLVMRTTLEKMLENVGRHRAETVSLISPTDVSPDTPLEYTNIDEKPNSDFFEKLFFGEEGKTRIGDVLLSIPPEQITIIDSNTTQAVPILRGFGSLKLPTGKGEVRLEMTMEVTGIDQWNNEVRPLMAQIIRSPWLPIQNYHLQKLFALVNPLDQKGPPDAGDVEFPVPERAPEGPALFQGIVQDDQDPRGPKVLNPSGPGPKTNIPIKEEASEDLFIVINRISIQTVPNFPHFFYLNITAGIFNHIPYVNRIRYLVDDDDVKKVIQAMQRNRERGGGASVVDHIDILRETGELDVNVTSEIGRSNVYKKYYQGLLSEYRIEQPITDYTRPTKPYKGMPYAALEDRVMFPLSEEATQDIIFRCRVAGGNPRKEINDQIDALLKAADVLLPKTSPSGAEAVLGGMGKLWNGVVDAIKLLYIETPSVLLKKLSGAEWYLQEKVTGEGSQLFIWNSRYTKKVPIEEYIDQELKDDSVRRIHYLISAISDARDEGLSDYWSVTKGLDMRTFDVHLKNDDQTVITGINASYDTRTVPITLLGHDYPTYQNLGLGEYRATVNVQTKDFALVQQISRMNQLLRRTKARVNAHLGNKTPGESFISSLGVLLTRIAFFSGFYVEILSTDRSKANLLQSLGIRKVVVLDATYSTVKGSPGVWSITLELAQNDIDIVRQEALVSGNALTEEIVLDIMKHLQTGEVPTDNVWFPIASELRSFKKLVEKRHVRNTTIDSILNSVPPQADFLKPPAGQFAKGVGELVSDALPGAKVTFGKDISDLSGPELQRLPASLYSLYLSLGMASLFPAPFIAGMVGRNIFAGLSEIAVGRQLDSTVRAMLIRPEIAVRFPDKSIVERLHNLFVDNMEKFDVCYPDLGLPPFMDTKVDRYGMETVKYPALYTPPDFYMAKDFVIKNDTIDLAQRLHSGFDNLVREWMIVNAVDLDKNGQFLDTGGRAGNAVHQLKQAISIKHVKDLQTAQGELAQINAILDGTSPLLDLYPGTLESSTQESTKKLLEDKKKEIEKFMRSMTDGQSGVSSIVEAATEEALQKYLWGFHTNESQKIAADILNEIVIDTAGLRSRDRTLQMARAHPTFKVYFVEQDSNHFLSFNDIYSYNGISSIDVVTSRKSASTIAVITMSNLTGVLTDPSQVEIPESFSALKGAGYQDTQEEQIVDGLFIRPGMRVIIKMGHSNDPTELDTVFDGAVTSVTPGEQVTITCQSWAAELNTPLGVEKPIHIQKDPLKQVLSYFTNTQEGLWAVGYGDVVRRVFQETGNLSQFGTPSPFQRSVDFQPGESVNNLIRTALAVRPISGSGNPSFLTGDRQTSVGEVFGVVPGSMTDLGLRNIYRWLFDKKDDNIWINWNNSVPWYGDITKKAPSWNFNWFISNQTGFEAIQELLLWFPGHIFAELPYNESNLKMQRSTLYVGPRNGLYVSEDIDQITNPDLYRDYIGWLDGAAKKRAETTTGISSPVTGEVRRTDSGLEMAPSRRPQINRSDPSDPYGRDTKGDFSPLPAVLPLNPAPTPSSPFGVQRPNGSGGTRVHEGTDFPIETGTPCYATIDGLVTHRSDPSGYGRYLVINGSGKNAGVSVLYAHLQGYAVTNNTSVRVGQKVAESGGRAGAPGSGRSSGPHLHYEVAVNGKKIDPIAAYVLVGKSPESRGTEITFTEATVDTSRLEDVVLSTGGGVVDKTFHAEYSKAVQVLLGRNRNIRPNNPEDLWGAPGMKRATRVHYLDNIRHIISNDIKASTDQMWNRVVMSYPDSYPVPSPDIELPWYSQLTKGVKSAVKAGLGTSNPIVDALTLTLPVPTPGRVKSFEAFLHNFDNDLDSFDLWLDRDMDTAFVKTNHSFQKNIDLGLFEYASFITRPSIRGIPMYYRIANSVLANGMREMYTGSMTILLDPTIRPWDRCYIFDYTNMMYGPISVQEVHHHIDFETGAYTTIVPDLIVEQQDFPAIIKDGWLQNVFEAGLGTAVAGIGVTSGLGWLFASGPIGGALGVGVGAGVGFHHAKKIWTGLGGWLLGRETGLNFSGLWYKGKPFTAGTEGMRRETMWAVFENKIRSLSEITKEIISG